MVINDIFTITNIESETFNSDENISVYPNPTNGILTIETDKVLVSYSLINMTGSIVASGNKKSINMAAFSNGVYMLRIGFKNSTNYIKIIKSEK